MTKEEQRELDAAKANIKTLITSSILEVNTNFNKMSEAQVGNIIHLMTITRRELIESLELLNKKIQEELVWD